MLIRLYDKKKPRGALQPFPLLVTLFVSAIWHGFYFGYYSFFLGYTLMTVAWKLVPRTALAQKVVQVVPYPVIFVVNSWVCNSVLSYFGMSYNFYFLGDSVQAFSNFNWMGHIGLILAIVLASILPKAKRKVESKNQKSNSKDTASTSAASKKVQ